MFPRSTTNIRVKSATSSQPKHKKLLFLDIDGVLHPLGENSLPTHASLEDLSARVDLELAHGDDPNFISPQVQGEFLAENMCQLCRVIAATDAEIILSSTWRTTPYQRRAAIDQLHKHGIKQEVFRSTPELGTGATCREQEICLFLDQEYDQDAHNVSTELLSYVCVDDADLCRWEESTFDPGCFVRCQASEGLTELDATKLITLLNRDTREIDES